MPQAELRLLLRAAARHPSGAPPQAPQRCAAYDLSLHARPHRLQCVPGSEDGDVEPAVGARSGLGGDLDSKLHHGPELDVLQHAVHAHDENLGRDAGVREPIRASLLNGAALLRSAILQQLGTDNLTVHSDTNVFWHSGMGVDVTTGNVQHKKPQKWMWQAANG